MPSKNPNNLGPRPLPQWRRKKPKPAGLGHMLIQDHEQMRLGMPVSDAHSGVAVGSNNLQSVTQERPLEEFMSRAQLENRDFTTERSASIKIVQAGDVKFGEGAQGDDGSWLTERHYENAGKLTIPRRPQWAASMTHGELDKRERAAFLHWRRSLADLQENKDLLLTPFERNIEVWRQLWRVAERSDLVVQIVDARNPLLYRSEDLEKYVAELSNPNSPKRVLLLVNKADFLSEKQRAAWKSYFVAHGIRFAFFSAKSALLMQESGGRSAAEEAGAEDVGVYDTTRVLSVDELEQLFRRRAPPVPPAKAGVQLQVGLVGYPNVGKSSTINALLGTKQVSVSATPGKTKHFQTISLSKEVMLCDCPGLVFPNFAQTRADLVCNGVLPIDQLRDYVSPTQLVCRRIPRHYLEAVYGINILVVPIEDGGTGVPKSAELLESYARARGFMRTGGGDPDVSRAARVILKDYVNGKLLYCEAPPGFEGDFNAGRFGVDMLPEGRRRQVEEAFARSGLARNDDGVDLAKAMRSLKFSGYDPSASFTPHVQPDLKPRHRPAGAAPSAGSELDREFFRSSQPEAVVALPFHLRRQAKAKPKLKKRR